MKLKTTIFKSALKSNEIAEDYTCDGDNISPPLNIEKVPKDAESLVLIIEDPDARGEKPFSHWVVFNIDPSIDKIDEDSVPGVEGKNDFGDIGYGGPCPPSGSHRYHFKLYALDTELDLDEGATREEVLEAMEDHILEKDDLVGLYCCRKKENK